MKYWKRLGLPLFCFWFAMSSRGTQFVPMSIEDLSRRAEIVVHGTVIDSTCLTDTNGRIYTQVRVQVGEVWKGAANANPLVIVHGGGTVGSHHTVVSGQVEYHPGEEIVAFLVTNSRGQAVTVGLAQGKFEVLRDRATDSKWVRNIFYGRTADRTTVEVQSTAPNQRLSLSELETRVKATLK